MSLVRQRRMTSKVTLWTKAGYDPDAAYGTDWELPVTYQCNFIDGGSVQRDVDGADFRPRKTVRLWDVDVNLGDKLLIGTVTDAEPPRNAEIVRGKKGGTILIGKQDITIYTG